MGKQQARYVVFSIGLREKDNRPTIVANKASKKAADNVAKIQKMRGYPSIVRKVVPGKRKKKRKK